MKEGREISDYDKAVKLNPEKPRRVCFEIHVLNGDDTFINFQVSITFLCYPLDINHFLYFLVH